MLVKLICMFGDLMSVRMLENGDLVSVRMLENGDLVSMRMLACLVTL